MDSSYAISSLPHMPLTVIIATLMPEVLTGCTAIILLIGGVFAGDKSTRLMQALALFVMVALLGMLLFSPLSHERQFLFSNLFVTDGFSAFIKVLLVAGTALVFLLSDGWLNLPEHRRPEFPVLILFSLLGMLLMVSANDLMSLYMGLELSSLALYVLAAFNRDSLKSTESGIKYFVLGSLSSGIYLFGASLVYGFAGTTSFSGIPGVIHSQSHLSPGLLTGLILIATAFCFKVSAAPFHMWTPDVYEGAPTPVTAFFSLSPKIAALAVLIRVLIQPFMDMHVQWQQIIIVASIASMLVGAFGALQQRNIKRLLAYSSIGHVGYAFIGLAAGTASGVASILLYFTLYLFMSAGTFAIILMMTRNGKAVEDISDLAGLSRTRPYLAMCLAIFMFSMAGIPPLSGFFSKMYVFLAALESGLNALAVVGVLASVVACFYYLRVIKVMYFDEPAEAFDPSPPRATRIALLVCTVVTLFYFLMPAPLVVYARIAAEVLFN